MNPEPSGETWRILRRSFEASRLPIIGILCLSTILRFAPIIGGTFPIGDGGLYLAMIKAFEHNLLAMPSHVVYGADILTYSYPPAAFWLAALIHNLTGVDEIRLLMFIPAAFASIVPLSAYLAAKAFFENEPRLTTAHSARRLALVTGLLLTLAPAAYAVMTNGGGLTKAPSFFFVLLALWRGQILLRERRPRDVIALAVCGGVAAMFHPDGALFLSLSLGVLMLRHFSLRGSAMLVAAALGCVLVTAPWWLNVLIASGVTPLLSAGSMSLDPQAAIMNCIVVICGESLVLMLILPFLCVAGFIIGIYRGLAFLPIWLYIVSLLDARNVERDGTFIVVIVATIGMIYGTTTLVNLLLALPRKMKLLPNIRSAQAAQLIGVIILIFVSVSEFHTTNMNVLNNNEILAMEAVAASTPPDASAAVLTGVQWGQDDISEWFPALSHRTSVNTVQGYEWMGQAAWRSRNELSNELQVCVGSTDPLDCVEATLRSHSQAVEILYVAGPKSETAALKRRDLTAGLRTELDMNPGWHLIFRNDAASIFVRSGHG